MNRLTTSFAWFVLAGVVGFAIDATILSFLMGPAAWEPLPARTVSFAAAVTATWLINRHRAFAGRPRPDTARELAGYFAIQTIGAAINFGIFLLCLTAWPRLTAVPVVPLAIGSAFALFFNFAVTRGTLYSTRTRH